MYAGTPTLAEGVGGNLSTAGMGWYYDLGVQYVQTIFSGILIAFPGCN